MEKEEIQKIAMEIVKCELIIQKNDNSEEIKDSEEKIMRLFNSVKNFEDFFAIGVEVEKILSKKIKK